MFFGVDIERRYAMNSARFSGFGGIWKCWPAAGIVGAMLLAGAFGGCTVKKPHVPSTNFTISIPVADDLTTIQEIVEDREDFLSLDGENLMALDFSAKFGDQYQTEIGDRLRVRPTSNSFRTPIGDIRLPGQDIPEISLSLNALLGQELPEGTVPLIPASSIDTRVEIPLEDVQSIVIKEGGLDIAINNGLPMPLSDLSLSLVDLGNGGVLVDELFLGEVAADGGTSAGAFVLDGKDISGSLAIAVTGRTVEVTNATVGSDASLGIAVTLRELVVTEATAVIPEQEFSDRQKLEFPDDRIQVTRADISEGGLTLRVRNDIPLIMEMELSLDDLKKPNGESNVFVIDNLITGEVREVLFDLDGNEFSPESPLELRLSYAARTVASGTPVTISSGGEIMVEAITEDLAFSRVEGVLNKVELPIPEVTQEVDFPQGLDNVKLASTSLVVHLTSAVGFRSLISLNVEGTNSAGDPGSFQVSEIFERGNPDNPVSLVIGPESADLTDFLNLLPTSITVEPTVLLGDGVGTEVIEPSHWVRVDRVEFRAPASLEITDSTQVRPDPIFRELQDEDARRRIEANLVDARVITRIENHLPLGVNVSLRVGSWRAIVRDLLATQRVDVGSGTVEQIFAQGWTTLPEEEIRRVRNSLLDYLIAENVWDALSSDDRKAIRRRIEILLGRKKDGLKSYDDARVLALVEKENSEEGRDAFINMLLGSLQRQDFARVEVEGLVGGLFDAVLFGRDITRQHRRFINQLLEREVASEQDLQAALQELEDGDLWDKLIKYYVYRRPDLRIPKEGAFGVSSAPVDAGRVSESVISREEIELGPENVIVFLRKGGVYTGVLMELPKSDGDVQLFGSDYINVRAATQIIMELNEDLVD